jgi:hypothetical protein
MDVVEPALELTPRAARTDVFGTEGCGTAFLGADLKLSGSP